LSVVEEESAVIDVVEKTSPAVVSIIITKDVPKLNSYSTNPFFNDPFFNPFGFRVPQQNIEPEMEKQEIGGGTGFVVSSDGYIITNEHVVDDEEAEYTVVMNDGSKIEATVLARDTLMDLAVIKINKTNLDFVEMGDSDSLKIGQTVVAIGNSLGEFRNTVSKGIISGLKRNVNAGNGFGRSELLEEVIQTDAAINPGNSGGPIINLKGQAIGVNVAMAQGAENIGFAIPINEVKKVYQSVKETGRIIRPFLGVRYMIVNDDVQQRNNLDVNYGALIVRGSSPNELAVVPNSPASKAGLAEGDIILEVGGKKIDQENDLAKAIKKMDVGDTVVLKVLSSDVEKIVQVMLEAAD
jgi:serine protease Do